MNKDITTEEIKNTLKRKHKWKSSGTDVQRMTLNCIEWGGSIPAALGNVKYLFITISSRSSLTTISQTV